jgi:hypothetical protein
MSLDDIRHALLCALGISYAILLVWFAVFVFAHDALHRLHARWFRLPAETFDALNYLGIAVFKIGALLLFAVPWLALGCVG